jgi:putative DNA primase/helicase
MPYGQDHDDQDEVLWPPPVAPLAVARRLLGDRYRTEGHLTLRRWRGGWMQWDGPHWTEIEDAEVRSWAYGELSDRQYKHVTAKGDKEIRPWNPNRRRVSDVLDALAASTHLGENIDPPAWLGGDGVVPASEIVACTNGLLHVGTRKRLELTPAYYNRVSVPFAYDPSAPEPTRWLKFLDELWPEDDDSIQLLREFFGYVLSGRTDQHKILLMVGPTRSGKGTIARVLTRLIGKGNVAGPTLASLATGFGLAPLLGKPLALISDARLGGPNVHQVVERLLSISGEDTLNIARKYRDDWSGKLPTRFVILSNELPRFGDASGAIANRFVVLNQTHSWLGRENKRLTDELLEELPGILSWALDGLDSLTKNGSFTAPKSSDDAIRALQDIASPAMAFVRDCCLVGPRHQQPCSETFEAWKSWCEANGIERPGTVQTFGGKLRAAVPGVRVSQPRDPITGKQASRVYVGVALNGESRVSVRVTAPSAPGSSDSDSLTRTNTRTGPLWSELSTCSVCGEPMTVVEPGQTSHPGCERSP